MDRLKSSERTLEDLESNSAITPAWRNRKTILGGLVNLLLGIMVRQMFLSLATADISASGIQRVSEFLQLAWSVQYRANFCIDIKHHW
jgi:hypothetical protein